MYARTGLTLGKVFITVIEDVYIVNAITQNTFGRDKQRVYVDYSAVRSCMTYLSKFAKLTGHVGWM